MRIMIKAASCFSQGMSLIDRQHFAQTVLELEAEKSAKGFGNWDSIGGDVVLPALDAGTTG